MKRHLYLLPLLAGALFISGLVYSQSTAEQTAQNQSAWPQAHTYTPVYALNNVSPTVLSASVDLSSYAGMFVDVTGTTGVMVRPEWSNDNTNGPWEPGAPIYVGSTPPMLKLKSFVRFRVLPTIQNQPTTVITPKVSVRYSLLSPLSVSVTVPTPTPGIQPVSPTVSTAPMAEGTLTGLTYSTQPFNLTNGAGVATAYVSPHLRAVRGGTSVVGVFNSVTYSTIVDALNGPVEVVTGASDKIYGPCFPPGTIFDYRASGTASVTVGYELYQCK